MQSTPLLIEQERVIQFAVNHSRYPVGVIFTEDIDGKALYGNRTHLSDYIHIYPRKVIIDSERAPYLNKSAKITFNNLSLLEPYILYNGLPCPADVCNNASYNVELRTFSFNVTHFSTYEVIEAPRCGDLQCQAFAGESCVSCASDCGVCAFLPQSSVPESSPTPSGGGGGGGGYSSPPPSSASVGMPQTA